MGWKPDLLADNRSRSYAYPLKPWSLHQWPELRRYMYMRTRRITSDTFFDSNTLKSCSHSTMSKALLRSMAHPHTTACCKGLIMAVATATHEHIDVFDLLWNPNCNWSQPNLSPSRIQFSYTLTIQLQVTVDV